MAHSPWPWALVGSGALALGAALVVLFAGGGDPRLPSSDLPSPSAPGQALPGNQPPDRRSDRRFGLPLRPAAPDAVREGLVLPVSTTAGAAEEEQATAVEVLVPKAGEVWCLGERVTRDQLQERLFALSEVKRDLDHPLRPSLVPALLAVGGNVRWREVQWAMQACADPAVRMIRLYWAVVREDGAEGLVPVFLPTKGTGHEEPILVIELKRREEETQTRVKLLDAEIGAGDEGRAELDRRVRLIFGVAPEIVTEINAWAFVPFSEVVRVVDLVRSAGGKDIRFTGAPPPPRRRDAGK
jgi:biopolymer transport protein ExbD